MVFVRCDEHQTYAYVKLVYDDKGNARKSQAKKEMDCLKDKERKQRNWMKVP